MKILVRKIVFLSMLIFMGYTIVIAQKKGQDLVDSLLNELSKEKTDTIKVKVLNKLSKTYAFINADEALQYAGQALVIAQKVKWDKGISAANFWIGHSYMAKSEYQKAIKYFNIALVISKKIKNKEYEAQIYNYMGWAYEGIYDYNKSILYYKKSIALYAELKSKRNVAGALLNLGVAYYHSFENEKMLDCYTKALNIFESIGDSNGMSLAYGNLALYYQNRADYPKSLEYFFKNLKIMEAKDDEPGIAGTCANIGITFFNIGENSKALEYQLRALKIHTKTGNKKGIAGSLNNIGTIYQTSDTAKALKYFREALKINRETGDRNFESINLINIGSIFHFCSDYEKSLQYYKKALQISKEIGNYSNFSSCYVAIGEAYRWIAIDSNKTYLNKMFGGDQMAAFKTALAYSDTGINVLKQIGEPKDLKDAYLGVSQLYVKIGRYDSALVNYQKYVALKDSMYNEENLKKISRLEAIRTQELHQKQIEIRDLQISKVRNERWYFIGGLSMLLILIIVIYNRYRFKIKANKIISMEKQRSDDLLLNILPSEVAEELKEKGFADAKQFDLVTVLFTDFKGFTAYTEKMSPQELVKDIDAYFKEFDRIITKYGIEKIKTIGDSYMCAGGLPVERKTNPEETVMAALEIRDFVLAGKQKKLAEGKPYFEIRIGVHTGPVVAGIVGIKKFAYDIWGDTVNIASRMESSGEAGKVNISGNTFELVKDKFKCEYRGKVEAKNKGLVDMYFVEGFLKNQ